MYLILNNVFLCQTELITEVPFKVVLIADRISVPSPHTGHTTDAQQTSDVVFNCCLAPN